MKNWLLLTWCNCSSSRRSLQLQRQGVPEAFLDRLVWSCRGNPLPSSSRQHRGKSPDASPDAAPSLLHETVYKKLDVRKPLTDHRKNKIFYHHSRSATIPAGGGTREVGNSSLREEERDNFVQSGAANIISTLAPRIVWNCTHGSLMQISSSKSNNRYGGDHPGLDEIMWEQGLIISAWKRLLLVQASTPTRCPSFGWGGAAWWQPVFPCRRMTTPVRKKELAELILHFIWWCCNTTEILPRSLLHLMLQHNKNLPSASAAATQDHPFKILFHLMLRHNKILLHLILAATQTRSFFFIIIIIIWCCNTNKILSAFDLISC